MLPSLCLCTRLCRANHSSARNLWSQDKLQTIDDGDNIDERFIARSLLVLAWWGWSQGGLALLQIDMRLC